MLKYYSLKSLRENSAGLLTAFLIGLGSYVFQEHYNFSLMDPLVLSLFIGILVKIIFQKNEQISKKISISPLVILTLGIVFYSFSNINYVKISKLDFKILLLLLFVILTYYFVIIILGKFLGQKKEITYLTATGSAICGASAIASIAPEVKAKSEDVTVSLLAVTLAALFGLFFALPLVALMFSLNDHDYLVLTASIMQFTGFVKASVLNIPYLETTLTGSSQMDFALLIKGARYLGLLVALPLFGSLVRKKIYFSSYFWIFLGSSVAGSLIYYWDTGFYSNILTPYFKIIYNVLWSVAMAAIGLSTRPGSILSYRGLWAIVMAFTGMFVAIVVSLSLILLFL